jgi:hypothetical protein
VILGGLVTITLVSLYVLPVACLRLGPDGLAPDRAESAGGTPGEPEGRYPGKWQTTAGTGAAEDSTQAPAARG